MYVRRYRMTATNILLRKSGHRLRTAGQRQNN
jgi:hypothetical protein